MVPFFDAEHDDFRGIVHEFVERDILPRYQRWEAEGCIDRDVWRSAAEVGLLGSEVPAEHGGLGLADWRFRLVVIEELGFAGAAALNVAFAAQDDLLIPALVGLGTREQRQRWLPGLAAGESIGAVAITEPGAGSDLRAIRSTAVGEADEWVLNGQKAFVSNGGQADLFVVAALATDDGEPRPTLFLLDADTPGVERGAPLHKLGLHAADTTEVFFTDCRIPRENVLGEVGGGLAALRGLLVRERLAQAAISWAATRGAFAWTEEHVFARRAFGRRIGDFQHSRFVMAEIETGLDVTRCYLERAVQRFNDGTLSVVEAAKLKWWASEQAVSSTTQLLQLFGGYGFMEEYPIARAFRDTRVQTVFAGTTEIMKEIIGRDIAARHV